MFSLIVSVRLCVRRVGCIGFYCAEGCSGLFITGTAAASTVTVVEARIDNRIQMAIGTSTIPEHQCVEHETYDLLALVP